MAQWYYVDVAHQRQGPVPAEALADAFRRGQANRDSLVWREGLPQWEPLAGHLGELGLLAPPPVPAAAPSVASTAPAGPAEVVDAGFMRRLGAYFLDSMIVGSVFYVVWIVGVLVVMAVATGGGGTPDDTTMAWGFGLVGLLYPVMSLAYYAGMESSKLQATVGKMAAGIKVVDAEGRRLTFGRAAGRWAASLLSYLTLYIGFLMAGWTRRKRALHDLAAGTYVVDRWAYTDQPGRQSRGLPAGVVAVIVLGLAMVGVAVLAILAAIAIPAYADYTTRARVAENWSAALPHLVKVAEFKANTDRCPRDAEEAGIPSRLDPDVREVLMIEDEGRCGVALVLSGAAELKGAANGVIHLRDLGPDGENTCDTDGIPEKLRPRACG